MSAEATIDLGESDKTPASLSSPNTGGDDFLGNEGANSNHTTHDPLHSTSGDGDRTSAEATGFASTDADGEPGETSDTQKGGGGL